LVDKLAEGLVESQKEILKLVQNNPKISKREMSEKIGISSTAVDKNINLLKKKGAKGGHWEIIKGE